MILWVNQYFDKWKNRFYKKNFIKRYHCKQGYVIRKSKTNLMEIYERGRMDYINQRSHK